MGRADSIEHFDANFVAQAKDFERAAKQDLEQQRTWLEDYAAADQKDRLKHERRLKREQARYWRRLRYRYARRLAFRYGSAARRFARATAAVIWKTAAIFAVLLALLAVAIGKWIVVRAQILALLVARSVRDAIAWTRPRAYRLAVRSRRRTVHALDWVALQTARMDAWAAAHRKRARGFAEAKASQALAFTSAQAKASAHATSQAAAAGYAWSAARGQDCARAVPPMMRAARREALHARRYTRAGVLQLRDGAALRLAALRDAIQRTVKASGAPVPQPAMKLLTFQPARGALVAVEPPSTALTVIEPAPWTGAAQRGISITGPEADAAPEPQEPMRKPRAVKARPRKARRGPRRKQHQSPAAPGKPKPRGRKRPRIS